MNKLFFDSWESILRTFIITVLAYVLLVFLLRVSGKRTLSKMNAFDLIVTIALGSTLATVVLNKSVALADGILAFFLLIALQYVMTYMEVRSKKISSLIKATPSLLVYKGRMLKAAMLKERVNEDEIHAVVRQNGLASMQDVGAVILETDGTLTLIQNIETLNTAVMKDVGKMMNP